MLIDAIWISLLLYILMQSFMYLHFLNGQRQIFAAISYTIDALKLFVHVESVYLVN
jgi:hypothetical protein